MSNTYLSSTAGSKHSYYNHLKREKYRNYSRLEQLAQTGVDFQSNEDLPDVAMIKQDRQQKIQTEIQRLKEPYREIFLLRTKLDLSFKEIGMIFNKNENWARVTYYRAKCTLAERMDLNEM